MLDRIDANVRRVGVVALIAAVHVSPATTSPLTPHKHLAQKRRRALVVNTARRLNVAATEMIDERNPARLCVDELAAP